VVNLLGLEVIDQMAKLAGIGKVPIMEEKSGPGFMGINIQVIYPAGVKGAGSSQQPVHFITFCQEQLCKITAILAGDSRNQGSFPLAHDQLPYTIEG